MGENPQRMFEIVKEKIVKNVRLITKKAEEEKMAPRDAALEIAQNRVREAMERKKTIETTKT
jgi:glutamate dehydrogenase/leucine dehydrogenase